MNNSNKNNWFWWIDTKLVSFRFFNDYLLTLKTCKRCLRKRGKHFTEIGNSYQKHIQSYVHHENIVIDKFFENYPDSELRLAYYFPIDGEKDKKSFLEFLKYTIRTNLTLGVTIHNVKERININTAIPFLLGGKLHFFFDYFGCDFIVTKEKWFELDIPILKCFLCCFNDSDGMLFPGTFFIKGHQYFCPSFLVPDNRRFHFKRASFPIAAATTATIATTSTSILKEHEEGYMQFFSEKTRYTEADLPRIQKLRSYFILNHLGNQATFPVGQIFFRLVENEFFQKIYQVRKRKNNYKDDKFQANLEKNLELSINKGCIEHAISRTAKFVNISGGSGGSDSYATASSSSSKFLQDRATDTRIHGYSPNSTYYRELTAGNVFQNMVATTELFKLITSSVTSQEFKTLSKTDFPFIDPIFCSDGANIGKTLALALDVIISWINVPFHDILDILSNMNCWNVSDFQQIFIGRDTKEKIDDNPDSLMLIINTDEYIARTNDRYYYDLFFNNSNSNIDIHLKQCFGLIEIIRYPKAGIVQISCQSNVLYKKMDDNYYYTPNEKLPAEIETTAFMGLVSMAVPFPSHNHGPKNSYVSNTIRSVCQYFDESMSDWCTQNRVWSLAYLASMMFPVEKSIRRDASPIFPLFCVPVIAMVTCLDGYNQMDGIVVNKSAVDRGLFSKIRFGFYKIQTVTNDHQRTAHMDVCLLPGHKLSYGDIICRISNVDEARSSHIEIGIDHEEINTNSVCIFWKGNVSRTLIDVRMYRSVLPISICKIIVRTRNFNPLRVGDKILSSTGQKSIVTEIVSEENLPFIHTKEFDGAADVYLHSNMIKRQTGSVFIDSINYFLHCCFDTDGDVNNDDGNNHLQTVFPFLHWSVGEKDVGGLFRISMERLEGRVANPFTGRYFKETGSIFIMSYQGLPHHNAIEKIYATANSNKIDMMTGQRFRGKSREGSMGLPNMELQVLLGKGTISILEWLLFRRSDDRFYVCNNNGNEAEADERHGDSGGEEDVIEVGSSFRRVLDDWKLMDVEVDVRVNPSIILK